MRTGPVVALVAAGALVVGGAVLDATDALPEAWPGVLTTAEPWEEPAPFPTVTLDPAPSAPPVLAELDADAPTPAGAPLTELTAGLLADPRLGGEAGVVVLDALTHEVLIDVGGSRPRTPASTVKLLTTAAALAALGEDSTLSTRTVRLPSEAPGEAPVVVLVGAGDVLLAAGAGDPAAVVGRAGLGDLAAATAAALAADGVTRVRLALDDTLFTGPAIAPGWGPIDLGGGFVAPVSALAVDRGKVPGRALRADDPASAAAATFAAALAAAGVAVDGEVVRRAEPDGALALAAVESATVGELVTHTLRESDNDVAEALARLVAVAAGEPGDFEHGTAAVVAAVERLGVDVTGVRMVDGSGLSEQSAVPPLVLARLVAAVADPARPGLVSVATGMPVAGLLGTLEDRFAPGDPAAGVLRAKTGTLLTVVSLAGTVLDADGRLLAFAVAADGVALGGVGGARDAVDAWSSELAACGCAPGA